MSTNLQKKVNKAFHKASLKDNTQSTESSTIDKDAWLVQAWPELQKPTLENLAQQKYRERTDGLKSLSLS
jgi:hypothetical protein